MLEDETVTIPRKEYLILQMKAKSTLGNNLCPDHRDKQAGKRCLACEIEGLERQIKRLTS